MTYKMYLGVALLAAGLLGNATPTQAEGSNQGVGASAKMPDIAARVSADISLTIGITRDQTVKLPGIQMEKAKAVNLMDKGPQCMEYKHAAKDVCCGWVRYGKKCSKKKCLPGYEGGRYDIQFWEPSEVIEVSCRTGYSMLAPGGVPSRLANYVKGSGDAAQLPQSCLGFNQPGNHRWFFEARVWAVNGYDGKLRHQAMGGTNGERARQCTLEGSDLPTPTGLSGGKFWGYGKKWEEFTRGSPNGPESSWEAYISDSDPQWALESSGATGGSPRACQPGSNDMQNCWGPVTRNGWVTHSNPKVAAALVAWRAHEMAQAAGKVSPLGAAVPGHRFSFSGGDKFQMMMDYPYLDYAGPFGASMGMKNGGKGGSQCFQPGDAGPEWYGGMKPEDIASNIMKLTSGTAATVAEINPGVYIFTIWVKSQCIRYEGMKKATGCCYYDYNKVLQWDPACYMGCV